MIIHSIHHDHPFHSFFCGGTLDSPVDINRGVSVLREDNTALRRVVHGSWAARARQRGVRVRKREVVPDARCFGVEGVGVRGHLVGSNGLGQATAWSHRPLLIF